MKKKFNPDSSLTLEDEFLEKSDDVDFKQSIQKTVNGFVIEDTEDIFNHMQFAQDLNLKLFSFLTQEEKYLALHLFHYTNMQKLFKEPFYEELRVKAREEGIGYILPSVLLNKKHLSSCDQIQKVLSLTILSMFNSLRKEEEDDNEFVPITIVTLLQVAIDIMLSTSSTMTREKASFLFTNLRLTLDMLTVSTLDNSYPNSTNVNPN